MFMESVGWVGNICLTLCGIPLAVRCLRTGSTSPQLDGLGLFLPLWIVGEYLTLAYVISIGDYPLLLNYSANVVALAVVMRYHFWPTNKGVDWLPKL